MTKAIKATSESTTTQVETKAEEQVNVTLTLPKGTKVAKQNIIAPSCALTANKERWFPKARLVSFTANKDGTVTITIAKARLEYRDMVKED